LNVGGEGAMVAEVDLVEVVDLLWESVSKGLSNE
jgi:hypothetical protein